MSIEQDNKAFVRYFVEEGLNKGNLALADEHFSADYEVHIPDRDDLPRGPEALKQVMTMWRTAFPDWTMHIDDLVAEGDKVVNRFTTRGTHTGLLMGMAPTGRSFTVHGVVIHRIVDHKVVETWVSDDVPGMLYQLGLLVRSSAGPPRGSDGAP